MSCCLVSRTTVWTSWLKNNHPDMLPKFWLCPTNRWNDIRLCLICTTWSCKPTLELICLICWLHFHTIQCGVNCMKGRNWTGANCVVTQVIFEHEGVFIHPGSDEDGFEQDLIISGSLRIVDKVKRLYIMSVCCVSLWHLSVKLEWRPAANFYELMNLNYKLWDDAEKFPQSRVKCLDVLSHQINCIKPLNIQFIKKNHKIFTLLTPVSLYLNMTQYIHLGVKKRLSLMYPVIAVMNC